MGKSVICKYKVRIKDNTGRIDEQGRDTMPYGVSEDGLEKFAITYGKSFERGGVNEQVSEMLGYVPYPNTVTVIKQKGSGKGKVWEWKAPAFMAW